MKTHLTAVAILGLCAVAFAQIDHAETGGIIIEPPPGGFGYLVYDEAVERQVIYVGKILSEWRERQQEWEEDKIIKLGSIDQTLKLIKDIDQKQLDVIGDPSAYQVVNPPGNQLMNYETDFDTLEDQASEAYGNLPADTKENLDKDKYVLAKMLMDSVAQAKSVVATSSAQRAGNQSKITAILNRVSTAQTFADLQKAQAELQAMITAQQILAADEQGAINVITLAEKAAQADAMLEESVSAAERIKREAEELDEMEAASKKASKEVPKKIVEAQQKGLKNVQKNWLKGSGDFESAVKGLKLGEGIKKANQEILEDEVIVIPASLPQEEIDKRVEYCEKHGLKYVIK
jgi:hypothetical protein